MAQAFDHSAEAMPKMQVVSLADPEEAEGEASMNRRSFFAMIPGAALVGKMLAEVRPAKAVAKTADVETETVYPLFPSYEHMAIYPSGMGYVLVDFNGRRYGGYDRYGYIVAEGSIVPTKNNPNTFELVPPFSL